MNKPIRIFGIGSPFGDDRAGWEVAQALAHSFDPSLVSVTMHDRPGAKLVAMMHGAQCVVLVDAVKSGAVPGTLHRLEGQAIQRAVAGYTSTHGFGLAEALQLAEKLGDIPPHIVLWGIEIETAAIREEVGSIVRDALPGLIKAVEDEVGALQSIKFSAKVCINQQGTAQ